MHFHQTVDCKLGSTIILKSQCNQWGRGLGSMGSWPSVLVKLLFSNNTLLLGCLCGPVINLVFGRLCTKTASRGREDTRVWYRETMFSQMVSYDFLLHGLLHEYFLYLVSAPPGKPRRRCAPKEGYLRCSKRFDHRSHFISFVIVRV